MLLLASGVIALQLKQTRIQPEAGWTWVPALLLIVTLPVSFEGFIVALIAFAVSALFVKVLSPAPGEPPSPMRGPV